MLVLNVVNVMFVCGCVLWLGYIMFLGHPSVLPSFWHLSFVSMITLKIL